MESLTEKIHGHRNRYVNSNIHKMEIPKGERRKSGGRWVEAIMKEECFVGTLTPLSVYAESFVLSFSLINPIRLLKKKREECFMQLKIIKIFHPLRLDRSSVPDIQVFLCAGFHKE